MSKARSRDGVGTESGRDEGGRFAPGNDFGKGRPARPVERQYLQSLADVVTPERWAKICERAAVDAERGDSAARAWIAGYVMGKGSLFELAKLEQLGIDAQHEVEAAAEAEVQPSELDKILSDWGAESSIKRAMRLTRGNHG